MVANWLNDSRNSSELLPGEVILRRVIIAISHLKIERHFQIVKA